MPDVDAVNWGKASDPSQKESIQMKILIIKNELNSPS